MFRSFRTAFLLLLALSVSGLANAADWKEGTHYNRLENPVRTDSDSGVEVAEVFCLLIDGGNHLIEGMFGHSCSSWSAASRV